MYSYLVGLLECIPASASTLLLAPKVSCAASGFDNRRHGCLARYAPSLPSSKYAVAVAVEVEVEVEAEANVLI